MSCKDKKTSTYYEDNLELQRMYEEDQSDRANYAGTDKQFVISDNDRNRRVRLKELVDPLTHPPNSPDTKAPLA